MSLVCLVTRMSHAACHIFSKFLSVTVTSLSQPVYHLPHLCPRQGPILNRLFMEFLACIFIIPMVRFLLHFFGWFWHTHELKFAKNVAFRCLYPRELILYARWSITIMISLFKNTGKDHKGTQLWAMKYVVCNGLINTVSFHTVSVHERTLNWGEW